MVNGHVAKLVNIIALDMNLSNSLIVIAMSIKCGIVSVCSENFVQQQNIYCKLHINRIFHIHN